MDDLAVSTYNTEALKGGGKEDHRGLKSLSQVEAEHIKLVLDACGWNKQETASILQISRGTLYRKILEYNLQKSQN